jgi:TolA-binding protein
VLLRDFPESADKAKANYWIGRTAFDQKKYKKAVPHLETAREQNPDFADRASMVIMLCHYNLEEVDALEKDVDGYKADGGKAEVPADVVRWLGAKNFEREKHDKAERFFQQLILRKEAQPDDYLLLARSRVKAGKFKDAVDSFDAYLAAVKDVGPRASGLLEKADAQIGGGDFDGADRTVRQGLELAPEGRMNGEFRLRAGQATARRGQTAEAAKIFEAISLTMDDDEVSPRALEAALECHRKLGDDADVKRLENLLRSRFPEFMQRRGKLAKP